MTEALLDMPTATFADICQGRSAGRGRVTLEQRLDAAWRLVLESREAECPVCDGPMRLEGAVGACAGCGARLT